MNPELLTHYRRELQHIREMGGEFAAEYPKIAGRLGLDALECTDPYVERLLEGFAFLAARVQLKIDTSYSTLARHLMEMVYPDYLSPIPSMLVAHFQPSMSEGSLVSGFKIERGTKMRSQSGPEADTTCQFVTANDLTLWPIRITESRVLSSRAAVEAAGISAPKQVRSALALKFSTEQGLKFSELPIDELNLFVSGADEIAPLLYEQVMGHSITVAVVSDQREVRSPSKSPSVRRHGFESHQAMLPGSERSFDGYRVLQEYFAFPERFQFLCIDQLASRIARCETESIELVFLFDNAIDHNAEFFNAENFLLNCAPAVNLFPKAVDRINLDRTKHEFHLIPDRTRPMDFEVYRVLSVKGHGSQGESQDFFPYFSIDSKRADVDSAFFSIQREQRLLSSKQKRVGPRSSYVGSEVFISLVDGMEAPYRSDLRQLSVNTLCTNRDLPLQMPVGRLDTDLFLEISAPVASIRCVAGPTTPRASRAHKRDAWQLISNLSLNYLSIGDAGADQDGLQAAAMLRQMLEPYSEGREKSSGRQIEGIVKVTSQPVVRQRRFGSHFEIAHGTQINLRLDESAFEGTGAYLMGAVLEHFFASYASINSFTETILQTVQRDEIAKWPVRIGTRQQI
ncbi:MAG: type VI secretion system baseplate subunit TssF [Pseudomonadota bacterium]